MAKRSSAARTTKRKAATRKTAARAAASRKTRRKAVKKPSRLRAATTLVRGAAAGAAAAVRRRLPGGTDKNDPIVLLETDHRRFEALLKQGEESTERATKTRARLLETLTSELAVHELLEERILYPALAPHAETREIVLEGFQEHHVADIIAKELQQTAPGDEAWGAKFKVLKENLEHHIQEEEREMFRAARVVLTRAERAALRRRMDALRRDVKRGAAR